MTSPASSLKQQRCHLDNNLLSAQRLKTKVSQIERTFTAPETTRIFVGCSHHTRIVCFLMKLASMADKSSPPQEKKFSIGFNHEHSKKGLRNVAVVKITSLGINHVVVQLVYRGLADEKAGKEKYNYWTAQGSGYILPINNDEGLYSTLFQGFPKNETKVVVYLVRHGRGEHNKSGLPGLWNKMFRDPLLVTEKGIEEAVGAIQKDITSNYGYKPIPVVDGFFSSPLLRCIQTTCLMMKKWNTGSASQIPRTIYILPCLHEFPAHVKKNHPQGDCDQPNNNLSTRPFLVDYFLGLPYPLPNAENASKTCIRNPTQCSSCAIFTPQLRKRGSQAYRVLQSMSTNTDIKTNIYIQPPVIDWSIFQQEHNCKDQLFTKFLNKIIATEQPLTTKQQQATKKTPL